MDGAPWMRGLDPTQVDTVEEFMALLRKARQLSGYSIATVHNKMVKLKQEKEPIESFATGTIHRNLDSDFKGLSRRQFVESYLRALGVSKVELSTWWDAFSRAASSSTSGSPGSAIELKKRAEVLSHDLDRVNRLVAKLTDDKARLEGELKAEKERREKAEKELESIREKLEHKTQGDGKLEALYAAAQQNHSRIEINIRELEKELQVVVKRHGEAEVERNSIIRRSEQLEEVSVSIDDQLALHYDRAEFERRRREEVERELRAKIAVLEELVLRYQDQYVAPEHLKPEPVEQLASEEQKIPAVSDRVPVKNTDISASFSISERDLSQTRQVKVKFNWYCLDCETGGERLVEDCPHCAGGNLTYSWHRKVNFTVPDELQEGYLRIAERGNDDYPDSKPGDVYIALKRRRHSLGNPFKEV